MAFNLNHPHFVFSLSYAKHIFSHLSSVVKFISAFTNMKLIVLKFQKIFALMNELETKSYLPKLGDANSFLS